MCELYKKVNITSRPLILERIDRQSVVYSVLIAVVSVQILKERKQTNLVMNFTSNAFTANIKIEKRLYYFKNLRF